MEIIVISDGNYLANWKHLEIDMLRIEFEIDQ
jgi:hypothetical protein